MNIPQHNLRPLPGAAASALRGGLLFQEAPDDDFGLIRGLCVAIPAGLLVWAVVALIALNN